MGQKNPRDFFSKVSQQTHDFEIHRLQKKGEKNNRDDDMVSFKEGEFIIQSKVMHHADKHFFIEEELEAEESKQAADCQVMDKEQLAQEMPYQMCEV